MIEAVKLEADIYPAGPRGLSAYEIYKKEGGQLREEEWLKSLNGLTPTIGENGNWFLGTVDTGLPSRGPKGDTGSIKFIVVTELPTENIDETAIYLKPVESPTGENKFEELIYVNGKWEDLGTPNVAVDLSNYYTKEESDKNLNDTISENMPLFINAPKYADFVGEKTTEIFRKWYNNYKNGKYIPIMLYTFSRIDWKYVYCFLTGIHDDSTGRLYLYFTNMKVNSSNEIIPSTISYAPTFIVYSGTPDKSFVAINANNDNGSLPFKQITNITNSTISNYTLTKTNNTAYTPTKDYHPSTKKYVDDAITDNISRFIPCYSLLSTDNLKLQYFSDNAKGLKSTYTEIGNAINDAYTKGYKKLMLHFYTNDDSNGYNNITFTSMNVDLQNQPTVIRYQDVLMNTEFVSTYFQSLRLDIYGTWSDNIFTVNSALLRGRTNKFPSQNEVLTKTNTTKYTPTSDYHPSTKLYTDRTHYENMAGYDASKTQVLKNINGTLTWVDEV